MTHPCWPDGDEIKLGHRFHTGDPSIVYTVDLISTNQVGGRTTTPNGGIGTNRPIVEVFRVLPPRPVAGDMPEHLAQWLEQTELTAGELVDAGVFLTTARRKALSHLFVWAKQLLVADADDIGSVATDPSEPQEGRS